MAKKTKYNQSLQRGFGQFMKLINNKWTACAIMIGIFWTGYEFGCKHEENKKNLEYLRIESEMQKQQQNELFALQEKIFNLEQDLRECENERKQNESREKEISKGDK